ncbi:hypothetical protein GCM10012320_14700 [Sinomonas cellulolyticus]|uniref:FHA domain-containing protein n=1 Tax=Sinomonas cellulolyticus TaxID=2801916 RepID=A0ABS1JZW3_9MICC|nr:FHA domain-containing protein [Sinomonas cellulolyticus]GHG47712.1 hypothetical protein GCM10012320_14700 [Sinomonas sp. KCTC 49339]
MGGVSLDRLQIGDPPLTGGAILVAGAHPSRPDAPPPLALAVQSGPAAGTVLPLRRGTTRLGRVSRGTHGVISLHDPDLSRDHAEMEVTDSGVVLRDLGSANGVWLQGQRIEHSHLATGQAFRIGSSTCTVEFASDRPLLDPRAGSGRPAPLRVERHPPPARRVAILTMAVLPLLIGVGMALLTGMWVFLAFTAVSAISPLIPLFEGRSARRDFARRLAEAAADDGVRRLSTSPHLGILARTAGVARGTAPSPEDRVARPAGSGDSDAAPIHLRLGTTDMPANIVIEPGSPQSPQPPVLRDAPFTVPLQGSLAIEGAQAEVQAMLRSILLQLAVVPAASRLRVLVVGGEDGIRLAARYLPRVRLLPAGARAERLLAAAERCAPVAVIALPSAESDAVLAASAAGWPVVAAAEAAGPAPDAVVRLGAGCAWFSSAGQASSFAPDLMPSQAFETAARHAAQQVAADDDAGIPERCGLDETVPRDADGIAAAWTRTARQPGLRIPLGRSDGGRVSLDLVAEGPHLLVAGTTGSGKSELLRSLIAVTAALHAPTEVTFLFLDFKGGSGLGPLTGLPHCVGLVTDLAEGGMDRTLASLRAELRRRERLLAAAQAADLTDYARRGGDGLPRLMIVVDEFRVLVEESAEALAELMRIATVGRSLGMHLVMATQRPQGAISADIRANVTTSIALRMQNEGESRDVIGSPLAARIPVRLPGRAYLSVGGGEPVEFQSASLTVTAVDGRQKDVCVADALSWLDREVGSHEEVPADPTPAEAGASIVAAAVEAWDRVAGTPVRTPVAPPLPESLAWGTAPSAREAGRQDPDEVQLGVADLPHEQRTAALGWSAERHGHLAFVGPSGSGAAEALATTAVQLVEGVPLRHLYILDGDGSLAFIRDHPRVGSWVGIGEPRRAGRVLARLGEECAQRVGRGGVERCTSLVLIVTGWGTWTSSFRSGPLAWAEEALGSLVRDGASAGVTVIAGGHRELSSSRAFGGMPARLFFPVGATEEARLAWPRLPAMPSLSGRAAAAGTLAPEAACAVQCYSEPPTAAGALLSQLGGTRPGQHRPRRAAAGPRPFRVDPLPQLALAEEIAALAAKDSAVAGARDTRLVVGLAGDEVRPLSLRLGSGEALLALGGPGTGKSAFMVALPRMNPHVEFVAPLPGDRLPAWERLLASITDRSPRGGPAPVVLVDDAHWLAPEEDVLLAQLLDAGASVVAAAPPGQNLTARSQVALRARYGGTGLLLQPRGASDGDFFGVRVEVPSAVVPGRAVVLVSGTQIEAQLGLAPESLSPARPPSPATSHPGHT